MKNNEDKDDETIRRNKRKIVYTSNTTATLSNTNSIIDVPRDGNCGFHVLLHGLKDLRKTDCLDSTSIQDIRLQIYNHGEKSFEKLKKKLKFCIARNWNISNWKTRVLSTIYNPNVDFNQGADRFYWWNCVDTTAIVYDLFQINIVIYTLPDPKTLAFEFTSDEIKYIVKDGEKDLEIVC